MNKDAKIAIMATMSSGKSTLINALLGTDLLPSKNEACTAKISRIKDNDHMKEFKCVCLDKEENVVHKEHVVGMEELEKYNNEEKILYLDIEGPIEYISAQDRRLVLIDTPGPNNSRNKEHGRVTDRILKSKEFEMIIYVMNITQFGINDDDLLLRKISSLMKNEEERLKDKFLFVVNKCDELDAEKGETVTEFLPKIKEYLEKFEIKNPNIIFTSAQMAKLIRMDKNGDEISRQERGKLNSYEFFNKLEELHLERFATISTYVKEKIKIMLDKAKKDEYEEALMHTGIPVLETYINEYLSKSKKNMIIDTEVLEEKIVCKESKKEIKISAKGLKSRCKKSKHKKGKKALVKIDIKYNPYTVETKIKIDGKEISSESDIYKKCLNNRLQFLIEKGSNWEGLFKELKKFTNDSECEITFHGRKIDFEDLEYKVREIKGITLKFIQGKDDKDILDRICKITKEIYNGPVAELRNEKIKNIEKEIKNSEFVVNVIATMSSGKSTLINSILGKELLPSKNEACTARVSRIKDNDSMDDFECECLNDKNEVIYKRKKITLEELNEYNDDENVAILNIEGPIKEISAEKMSLVLVDTPGPNNSRNENHSIVTNRIIQDKKKSVVLYVINTTQFGINDDANLLRQISNEMSRGGKQSRDRFIFVVNKCDQLDVEKGETVDELLVSVRKYLKNYGIEEPNLYPVSAQMAKLIRRDKEGERLTRQEASAFVMIKYINEEEGYHFEKFATLSPSVRKKIEMKLKEVKESKVEKVDYEEALIHTGVPALEEALNEYLEKYAFPIKVKETTDRFADVIKEMDMINKLEDKINSSSEERAKIEAQINDARVRLENKKDIEAFEERIENLGLSTEEFEKVKKENLRECKRIFENFSVEVLYDETGAIKDSKIELEEARIHLYELESDLKRLSEKLDTELNIALKNTIEDEGTKIFEDFNKYVDTLKAAINIQGFEITNMRKIKSIVTKSMEEEIATKKEKEDIYETVEERSFLNKISFGIFGKSEYKKIKVGEKEFIDIEKFINVQQTKIIMNICEAVEEKQKEALEKQNEQKAYYKEKIKQLYSEIRKMLEEMNNLIQKKESIGSKIKNIEHKKKWINDLNLRINKIMEI